MAIRVVSDSSSNLLTLSDIDYKTVPLKIMFGSNEYVDELGTDVTEMVRNLQTHSGPSTTSCPNVHDWLSAFEGADEIFAITISSGLSASFESAEMAREMYLTSHPEARVHVFDSKATGPVMQLVIESLKDGILAGKTYDEIIEETNEALKHTRILYALQSLNNLANNGRVNSHVARLVGALNIRIIGDASLEGTIELIHRCRGEKRTLKTIVTEMAEQGCNGGKVRIDHCLNETAAQALADLITEAYPQADVAIRPCGGLCSYYADMGGLIIGYESVTTRENEQNEPTPSPKGLRKRFS